MEGSHPDHEHFVETEGGHPTEAALVGFEQRFAIGDDGMVHGASAAPQFHGHLVHAPSEPADLEGHPHCRTGGEELAGG